MAKSLLIALLSVLLMIALFNQNEAEELAPEAQPNNNPMHGVTEGSLHPQDCSPRCANRCSATQHKKACLFFCNKCCATCLCVPPGTYGNKQVCPCYNNWKTQRGGPKCP